MRSHDGNGRELASDDAAQPVKFVDSPEFHEPDADEKILFPLPATESSSLPSGADPLVRMLAIEPLSKSQQIACFRMMNYLKFRASRAEGTQRQGLLGMANQVRHLLCITNQRFVAYILGRRLRRTKSIDDKLAIMSDGNLGLMRAIDRFDYSGGFSFLTYAGISIGRPEGAIVNHAKRWARIRQFGEFPADGPGGEPESAMVYVESREPLPPEACIRSEGLAKVRTMLKRVHPSHRKIVEAYVGISGPPQKMEEIAEDLGVSTTRVSQVFRKALAKMSKAGGMAVDRSQSGDSSGQETKQVRRGRAVPDWLLIVWDQARLAGVVGSMESWRRDFVASSNRMAILAALLNRVGDSLSISADERRRLLSTVPGWLLDAWNVPEDEQLAGRWTSPFARREPATRRELLIELIAAEAEMRRNEIASYDAKPQREPDQKSYRLIG